MSDGDLFYRLGSVTMEPCYQSKEAHTRAMRTVLCPVCTRVCSGVESVDVWLQERPRDRPLNFLFGCQIGVIHRELLDLLDLAVVKADLILGRVYHASGKEIPDWRTFLGRRVVLQRGCEIVDARTCLACRRPHYYALGRPYLYPAPPNDATIYANQFSGLIVPPQVYEIVARHSFRRLGVTKLPVLSEPLDGLGQMLYQ